MCHEKVISFMSCKPFPEGGQVGGCGEGGGLRGGVLSFRFGCNKNAKGINLHLKVIFMPLRSGFDLSRDFPPFFSKPSAITAASFKVG